MLTRITDLYIMPEVPKLLLSRPSPERLAAGIAVWNKEFDVIEGLLGELFVEPTSYDPPAAGPFICGKKMTLGDVSLAGCLAFVLIFMPRVNYDPFQGRPRFQAWWEAMNKDHDYQVVRRVVEESVASTRARLKKEMQKEKASKL